MHRVEEISLLKAEVEALAAERDEAMQLRGVAMRLETLPEITETLEQLEAGRHFAGMFKVRQIRELVTWLQLLSDPENQPHQWTRPIGEKAAGVIAAAVELDAAEVAWREYVDGGYAASSGLGKTDVQMRVERAYRRLHGAVAWDGGEGWLTG